MAAQPTTTPVSTDKGKTQFLRSPPGVPTHVLMVVACSLILWGARVPAGDFSYFVAGLIAGAMVILNWMLRVVMVSAARLPRSPSAMTANTGSGSAFTRSLVYDRFPAAWNSRSPYQAFRGAGKASTIATPVLALRMHATLFSSA